MAVVNEARQGGWRCWFAKKEKKRDGGGGGGGGGEGGAVWLFV